MRFHRMSGLSDEQLNELESRVSELLEQPWDKGTGRPKELTLREALVAFADGETRRSGRPIALTTLGLWVGL